MNPTHLACRCLITAVIFSATATQPAQAGDYSVIVKPTGAGGGDLAWCIGDDPEDELKLAQDLESEGWPVLWLDVAPSLLPA